MELPYMPKVGTIDYEIIEILKELCPDFAPYNYLRKLDLYKGSLFGGKNIYFKNGTDETKGMVTSKTNIKLYGLDRYPYNFQTRATHDGKTEYGWSGLVLLNLLQELRSQKDLVERDTKVLCLATGKTYELVLKTCVTAHPLETPYPKEQPKYIVPIKKGGQLEFLFKVKTVVDCLPTEVFTYETILPKQEYLNLIKYHKRRQESFGYGKDKSVYRFYIFDLHSFIIQPFNRKNIQISTWINFLDIPKKNIINKKTDGLSFDEKDTVMYEGHLTQAMVNKYERNPIARKKCIEYHGAKCLICGMDFGERYGELGEGFIHVHHLKPLHTIGQDYIVDYKNDLIPVCPNCHAMIHRIENGENMTVEEIKEVLESNF